jgi:hypothetical protein
MIRLKYARPYSTVMTIAPDTARYMLQFNTRNRKLNPKHVAFFAAEIKRGAFHTTGQAIAFDWNGTMIDGQHRLHGCVMADTAITVTVAFGLEPDTYLVTDVNNMPRSPATILAITAANVADANMVATQLGLRTSERLGVDIIRDVRTWLHPINDALEAASARHTAGLYSVPTRLGFGLRWAVSPPDERHMILDQWAAFQRGDAPSMEPAVLTLWQRASRNKLVKGKGNAPRFDAAATVFTMLSPKRIGTGGAFIENIDLAIGNFDRALRLLEPAYLSGPDSAGHPYKLTEKYRDWRNVHQMELACGDA